MNHFARLAAVLLVAGGAALAGPAGGKAVYDKSCKSCHGPGGDGNPAIAKIMKVTLRPLGGKEVQSKSDGELKDCVAKGTGKMKPVASVTGKGLDDVVAHLRTLKK